jgi:hypothetical protein
MFYVSGSHQKIISAPALAPKLTQWFQNSSGKANIVVFEMFVLILLNTLYSVFTLCYWIGVLASDSSSEKFICFPFPNKIFYAIKPKP